MMSALSTICSVLSQLWRCVILHQWSGIQRGRAVILEFSAVEGIQPRAIVSPVTLQPYLHSQGLFHRPRLLFDIQPLFLHRQKLRILLGCSHYFSYKVRQLSTAQSAGIPSGFHCIDYQTSQSVLNDFLCLGVRAGREVTTVRLAWLSAMTTHWEVAEDPSPEMNRLLHRITPPGGAPVHAGWYSSTILCQ